MNLKELKKTISNLSPEEFLEFQVSFEKIEAARKRKQRAKLDKLNSRRSARI